MTTTSYRAVQASKPGRLEVVERELTAARCEMRGEGR
jgi:hypothetical protein